MACEQMASEANDSSRVARCILSNRSSAKDTDAKSSEIDTTQIEVADPPTNRARLIQSTGYLQLSAMVMCGTMLKQLCGNEM